MQTTLATLNQSATPSTTIYVEPGDWDFTLIGYQNDNMVLKGELSKNIPAGGTSLAFEVAPVSDGTGTINITITLPSNSGIDSAEVYEDGSPAGTVSPSGNTIVFQAENHPSGVYYVVVKLYKNTNLYGTVSETYYVWANLVSKKTYTLSAENLNLMYPITYHEWGGNGVDKNDDYYKRTDATLTLPIPFRQGYIFRGWYENAGHTGARITTILAGSMGTKEFYAKWSDYTNNNSLADFLAWVAVDTNVEDGDACSYTLSADEILPTDAPKSLSYTGKNVSITLMGDTTEKIAKLSSTGSFLTVGNGVTLTLGSNFTLQGLGSNNAPLVQVDTGGTLAMESGSKITGNTTTSNGGGVSVNGGLFTMNGGEISNNNAANGGGVSVEAGTFTMRGGAISTNTASGGVWVSGTGTFTMNGGEISNNSAANGGGVRLEGGLFTMNGGTISNNTATSGSGGGVRLEGGLFTMNGGTISNNNAPVGYGGAVSVVAGSSFTMSSGEISNNSAIYGAGVSLAGPFTMSGGTISHNTATTQGGGVNVNGSTFTMNGGEISNNTVTSGSGGGVFVNSGTFTKAAAGGTIYGSNDGALANTTSGTGNAAYVATDSKKRDTTARPGVALDSEKASVEGGGWEDTLTQALTWLELNAATGRNYTIILYADESSGQNTLSYPGKTVNITLIGDVTERIVSLSSNGSLFTVASGITLTLGNNVILQGLGSNNAPLVQVDTGGTLVMDTGSKITGNISASDGGGVSVDNGALFTMNGGEISGNSTANRGGGVRVNGTFTMTNGDISGNTASEGGGVLMDGTTFTMSGGTISHNSATSGNGGGVFVASGTFTKTAAGTIYGMNDGTLANTASGTGYTVYVANGSKVRDTTAGAGVTLDSETEGIAGGWDIRISTMTAQDALTWLQSNAVNGGNYTIILSDGNSINGQTLSYGGKKVSITLIGDGAEQTINLGNTGTLFSLTSGVTLILGENITLQGTNSTDNSLPLVTVGSGAALVMNTGSKLTGNTIKSGNGAGVEVQSGGLFTMYGGEISNNKANGCSGGGVEAWGGTFIMYGGTISGNTTTGNGGGVWVSGGTLIKYGGIIYGSDAAAELKNTANGAGHAVQVVSGAKRNTTAGEDVPLDSRVAGSAGGWE
jgi:uncharacterized repeat protein (TIGR02543 family)